jgi:hypothetical protein
VTSNDPAQKGVEQNLRNKQEPRHPLGRHPTGLCMRSKMETYNGQAASVKRTLIRMVGKLDLDDQLALIQRAAQLWSRGKPPPDPERRTLTCKGRFPVIPEGRRIQ